MMQRDYLLKQVEQLGLVLGAALSKLLGLKNQPNASIQVSTIYQVLGKELDFNIDSLLTASTEELISALQSEHNFDSNCLETLADILSLATDEPDPERKNRLYEKSLAIYEYLDRSDPKTFSYSRPLKIEKLKSLMRST